MPEGSFKVGGSFTKEADSTVNDTAVKSISISDNSANIEIYSETATYFI